MQWYEKEKGRLIVNNGYTLNEDRPFYEDGRAFDGASSGRPGGWQPLFEKTSSAPSGMWRVRAVLRLWQIHLGIAVGLCVPIVLLGRKRAHWRPWELLAVVLPFSVWVLLMVSPLSIGRKGSGNLVEPFYLALGVPIAAIVRVWTGPRLLRPAQINLLIAALLGALCTAGAAVFFLVPPWLTIAR